jgi:hypothetical protein
MVDASVSLLDSMFQNMTKYAAMKLSAVWVPVRARPETSVTVWYLYVSLAMAGVFYITDVDTVLVWGVDYVTCRYVVVYFTTLSR